MQAGEYRKIKRPFPPTTRTYPVAPLCTIGYPLRQASTRETCESENPHWLEFLVVDLERADAGDGPYPPVRSPLLSGSGFVGRIETVALRRCEPDTAMVLVAFFRHRQAHPSGVASR